MTRLTSDQFAGSVPQRGPLTTAETQNRTKVSAPTVAQDVRCTLSRYDSDWLLQAINDDTGFVRTPWWRVRGAAARTIDPTTGYPYWVFQNERAGLVRDLLLDDIAWAATANRGGPVDPDLLGRIIESSAPSGAQNEKGVSLLATTTDVFDRNHPQFRILLARFVGRIRGRALKRLLDDADTAGTELDRYEGRTVLEALLQPTAARRYAWRHCPSNLYFSQAHRLFRKDPTSWRTCNQTWWCPYCYTRQVVRLWERLADVPVSISAVRFPIADVVQLSHLRDQIAADSHLAARTAPNRKHPSNDARDWTVLHKIVWLKWVPRHCDIDEFELRRFGPGLSAPNVARNLTLDATKNSTEASAPNVAQNLEPHDLRRPQRSDAVRRLDGVDDSLRYRPAFAPADPRGRVGLLP
jgi:hypothetical protein